MILTHCVHRRVITKKSQAVHDYQVNEIREYTDHIFKWGVNTYKVCLAFELSQKDKYPC